MLCGEIPIDFYIQKLGVYLQNEDRTISGAKEFIGADEETFAILIQDENFKRLIDLI